MVTSGTLLALRFGGRNDSRSLRHYLDLSARSLRTSLCRIWWSFYRFVSSMGLDGNQPDRFDLIGAAFSLIGVFIIMYWAAVRFWLFGCNCNRGPKRLRRRDGIEALGMRGYRDNCNFRGSWSILVHIALLCMPSVTTFARFTRRYVARQQWKRELLRSFGQSQILWR
jgi:hypothetical protein